MSTVEVTFDFACRDDCLDRMVPSDLRALVAERDRLRAELAEAKETVAAERERCAKLCDAQFWIVTRARGGDAAVAAGECAAAIRGANESISGQLPGEPLYAAESRAPLETVEARYKDLMNRLGVQGHDGAVAEIAALRKAASLAG